MGVEGMEGGVLGSLYFRKFVSFILLGRCLVVVFSLRVCSFNVGYYYFLRFIWFVR